MATLLFFLFINGLFFPLSAQQDSTSRKLLSVPSDAATTPLPPLIGLTPPLNTAQSPRCNPYPNPHHGAGVAAPPVSEGGRMAIPPAAPPVMAWERLWCVSKPSVPSEKLQEAMDYACGEGGADCGPISPAGRCYLPDTIVAHASYAFNSYWQRNKKNGGTCSFGGTAMLVNSDPSFLQCHYTLA